MIKNIKSTFIQSLMLIALGISGDVEGVDFFQGNLAPANLQSSLAEPVDPFNRLATKVSLITSEAMTQQCPSSNTLVEFGDIISNLDKDTFSQATKNTALMSFIINKSGKENQNTGTFCPRTSAESWRFSMAEQGVCQQLKVACGNIQKDNSLINNVCMASDSNYIGQMSSLDVDNGYLSYKDSETGNKSIYTGEYCNEPGVKGNISEWEGSRNPCHEDNNATAAACSDLKVECKTGYFVRFPASGTMFCDELERKEEDEILADKKKTNENYGTISCCNGFMCASGKSCNFVESSTLNDGSKTNDSLFSLMSHLTRTGKAYGEVSRMENPKDCEACWRAAYNSALEKGGNSYLENRNKLFSKINKDSSSKAKNSETVIKMKKESLASYLSSLLGDTSIDSLPFNKFNKECLSRTSRQVIASNSRSCDILKLEEKSIINGEELKELIIQARANKTKILKAYNDNSGDLTNNQTLDLFVEQFGSVFDKDLVSRDPELAKHRENLINDCKLLIGGADGFSGLYNGLDEELLYDRFLYIKDIKQDYEEKVSSNAEAESLRNRFIALSKYAGDIDPSLLKPLVNPGIICDKLIEDEISSLAEFKNFLKTQHQEDIGNFSKKLSDWNTMKTGQFPNEFLKAMNSLCPDEETILKAADCETNSTIRLSEKETENIKDVESQIILKEMICKGEVEVISDDTIKKLNEESNLLSTIANNHAADIASSGTTTALFQGFHVGDTTSRRIHTVRGNDIASNSGIGRQVASIKDEANSLLESAKNSSTFSDFSKKVSSLKSTFSESTSNLFSGNSNDGMNDLTRFTDSDIQQTIQSEPAAQNLMDSIASNIENSADKEINAIENPGQAIMDYLKDKETASSEALENSQLREQLDELKKLVAEKKVTEARKIKENDKIELDAAKARIRNLEGMISQLRNPAAANVNFGNTVSDGFSQSGEASGNYGVDISRGRLGPSGAGNSAFSGGRGPASVQSPLINKIPKSVGEDLKRFANSGIEMKGESLVLRVDESSYPLEVEEVIMNNGIISGIKVQNSFKGSVEVLSMSELNSNSKKAVEEYIEKMASSILAVEEDKLAEVKAKADASAARYIDFLCASNPERSECKQ